MREGQREGGATVGRRTSWWSLVALSVVAVSCGGDDLGLQVAAGGSGEDGPVFEPPPFPGLPTDAILPSTSAGSLDGSLEVTPLGSASYTLPIDVPVGRRGMQPSLALTYDSNAGSSWLGVGFAISGLPSSVRRCATPAPFTDGNGQGGPPPPPSDNPNAPRQLDEGTISYVDDASASYCWGSERLIRMPSERHEDYEEYRPWTSPNTRLRVSRTNDGRIESWTAELPSGRVLRFEHIVYGTAHVTSDAGVRSAVPGRVIEWALTREQDLYGNTIEYLYDTRREVDANSYLRHRISEIRYTGFTDDGETTPGLRSVRFVTEPRPDVMSWRRHGVAMISDERLARVEVHGPDVDGTARRFWYYRFDYRNDSITQRSLLRRVRQCDANDVCNPPTRFDWDMGSLGVERGGDAVATGARHSVADMDGDGFDELLVGPFDPLNPYEGPFGGSPSDARGQWRRQDLRSGGVTTVPIHWAPAVLDLTNAARHDLLGGRFGSPVSCADAGASTERFGACSVQRDVPAWYRPAPYETCVAWDTVPPSILNTPPWEPELRTPGRQDDKLRCWRDLDPDGDGTFYGTLANGFWLPGVGQEDGMDGLGRGWNRVTRAGIGLATSRVPGLIPVSDASTIALNSMIPGSFFGDPRAEFMILEPPDTAFSDFVSGFPMLYKRSDPAAPGAFGVLPVDDSGTFEALVTANVRMSQGSLLAGDFDGDGHTDVLVSLRTSPTEGESVPLPTYGMIRFGNGGRPRLSLTTLPTPPLFTLGPSAGRQSPDLRVAMDVNGDGLADVVDTADVDASGRTAVYFNEAGSFTPRFYLPAPGNTPLALDLPPAAQEVRARAVDWDLDGRTDLMILDDSPRVLLSRTDRFVVRSLPFAVGTVRARATPAGAAGLATRAPVVFADFTGDGIDDVLVGEGRRYTRFERYARTTSRPDRLRAVRAPTGAESRVEYATLRDATVGIPCWELSTDEFDAFDVETFGCARATTQVVRRLFEPTDVAGALDENEHIYGYMRGRRDSGGALLGFERVQHYDSAGSALEEVLYRFEEVVHEWSPVRGFWYAEPRTTARPVSTGAVVLSSTEAHATLTTLDYETRAVTEAGVYRYPGGRDVPSLGLLREQVVGSHERQLRVPRSAWAPPPTGGPLDVLDPFGGPEPEWFSEEDSTAVPNLLGFVEEEVTVRGGPTTPIVRTETRREPFLASSAYLYGMAQRESVTDTDVSTGRTGTRTMAFEWNELGGIDAAIREPGAGSTDPKHVFLRVETTTDVYGQPREITMRDAEAMAAGGDLEHHVRVTSLTYDELDGTHLRSVTSTLDQLQWVGLHPTFGVPLVATDSNGITGYFRYDGFGRVRETRAPGGATTTFEYRHTAGRDILTRTDSGGGRSETRLDSLSRPQQFTERMLGGDFGSSMTYDVLGRAVEATIPRLSTATGPRVSARRESDIFGRPTRTSFVQRAVGGGITQTVTRWRGSYEVGGTTATFTDTDSVRFAEADHHGRVVRSGDRRESVEEERSHSYGAFDLPASSLDVIGAATTVEYDTIGRPTSVTDADRGLQTIAYNAFGEVTTITDALGVTSFDRDDLGRKLHEHRTEEDVTTTVASFFWDTAANGIGRIDYAAVPSTGDTIAYRYDVFGRVQRETRTIAGEVFETDMSYDSVGRLRRVQYPRANGRRFSVFYRYDPSSGALTRVESCAAGCVGGAGAREGEVLWELRQVDGLGRPLEDVRGGMTTSRTYDELRGTLQTLTTRNAAAAALQQWIYVADDEGRFAARGEAVSPRIELFGYDTFDRLQSWNVFTGPGFLRLRRTDTFGYEPRGGGRFQEVTSQNLRDGTTTRESYAYPEVEEGRPHAASEVTRTLGSASVVEGYGYDERGRQRTGPGRTIDYTHFDLPWRVTTAAGTTTFEYDAFHQRTRSIRPEGVVTHVGELYERRQNGQVGQHVFYVHTPVGLVAQVEEIEGSSARTTKYFHDDGLRSVSLITNPTGLTVHGRQWFGPFGQRLALDGTDAPPETTTVVRGFTEHRQEDALGLIDMRGRFYDPRLRQFLTPDPLEADPLSSQGTNPYSYVMNRPPNAWDPSGFDDEDWIFVDSDHTGTRHYRGYQAYEGESYVTALERSTMGASGRRDGEVLLAQAVTPGEMTVMSDASPSLGGETGAVEYAQQLFSRLPTGALENIGAGFVEEIQNHGLAIALGGVVIAGLESIPFVDIPTTIGLFYLLYEQISENWDYLIALGQRLLTGNTTPEDQRAVGMFLATIVAGRCGGEVGGRAAVAAGLTGASGVGVLGVLYMVRRQLTGALRARVLAMAGFAQRGIPIILDENIGSPVLANALRAMGFNIRTVPEIFGRVGLSDAELTAFARAIGGRVLTQNGRDFPTDVRIVTDARVGIDSAAIARIINAALGTQ